MRTSIVWKEIIGYENKYLISNYGDVKSVNYNNTKIEHNLTKSLSKKGYETVALYNNGKRKYFKVHRLVAEAFIPNPTNKLQVNHIDENKQNNSVNNLEWCDAKYNNNYGKRLDKCKKAINQYDLNNNLINSYDSILDASKSLKVRAGNICECCKNKRLTAYGYKWQYKEVD